MPTRGTVMSGIAAVLGMVVLAITAVGATIGPSQVVAPAASVPTAPAADALRQLIEEGNPADLDWPATLVERQQLGELYEAGGYRLLWSNGTTVTAAALDLLHELQQAGDRGLDPADYPAARLAGLLEDARAHPAAVADWALVDTGLSLAAMRFAADLHDGRIDPAAVGHHLTVEHLKLAVPAAVAQLAAAGNVAAALDALEPPFLHYALLKRQLQTYRRLAAGPALEALPPLPARSVKPGEAYAGAAALLRLLVALGDAAAGDASPGDAAAGAPPAAPGSLTPPLVQALRHFQGRHGEPPDGVLGAATFAELTRPLSGRVRQIELTMERWRWLPGKLASAPIIVNIPQFRLFAFESTADTEATIRQMDVIVGKAFQATQTPVFTADMTYLIFRPYWEVPYSIAVKEIVPGARAHADYLDTHQMELVRGAGDGAAILPNTRENIDLLAQGVLRVRQKPGPDNSLGLVKFMFPNPYNVYLHSTPAKALFQESRRDFSHGCVRVSDPVGLAEYVLRESPQWTHERIVAAMNGTGSLTVKLKDPIRVYIVYGTALATEDGRMLFFDDIYGHDQRLEAALDSRRPDTARSRSLTE